VPESLQLVLTISARATQNNVRVSNWRLVDSHGESHPLKEFVDFDGVRIGGGFGSVSIQGECELKLVFEVPKSETEFSLLIGPRDLGRVTVDAGS